MLLIEETFEKYGYYIEDFTEKSSKNVIVQCDYCGDKTEKPISGYNNQRKNLDKDSCNKKECKGKKLSETKLKKSGVPEGLRRCSKCGEIKELNAENFTKSGFRYGKQNYKHACRECSRSDYHSNKELISEKIYNLKEAIEVYEEKLKSGDILPYNFYNRLEDERGFVDYIFKIKTNAHEGKFRIFNNNFIREYKLNGLIVKYRTIYGIINHFYPDYIQPWELVSSPQGYWNDIENSKRALLWFVEKLFEDKIIQSIEDLPSICTYDLAVKYNLGGLVANKFNHSIFQAIDFIYPNKFKVFEFNLPPKYYKSKENRLNITRAFIGQLLEDKVIDNLEEIPYKINIYTFEKYNLRSFLQHVYQGVSFKALNELFPNKWKVWEFRSCPSGFWNSAENIYDCTDWLVAKLFEDKLINSINELPSVFSYKLFEVYCLASLYSKRKIAYEYLAEKYKELSIEDFNLRIANDGTKCLSKQEVILHNLFLENSINAKYCTKKTLFYNDEIGERYSPDWIINDNIIVEYYGLYVDHYHNSSLLRDYRLKTERKNKFYKNLKDFKFIDIYPYDLLNGYEGLKNKFNKENISMVHKGKSIAI